MGQTTKIGNSCVCDEQLVPSYAPGSIIAQKLQECKKYCLGEKKKKGQPVFCLDKSRELPLL